MDQNPGTPAATSAEKEIIIWQDRLDHGLVKVADKWMTPDDRDALRAKSVDVAIALHDSFKQGRMKVNQPPRSTSRCKSIPPTHRFFICTAC